MRTATKLAAAVVLTVAVMSLLPDDSPTTVRPASGTASPSSTPTAAPADAPTGALPAPSARPATPLEAPTAAPAPAGSSPAAQSPPTPAAGAALLQAAGGGDGDSWKDTRGQAYRLGMVNAPETGECFGSEATAERKRLVAAGFRADVYAGDRYGRGVSVVTTATGVNVNVHLARHGFVDDRYLAQFRDENPPLAAQLDRAFAAAKAERTGLWRACAQQPQAIAAAPAPTPRRSSDPAAATSDDCHSDYATCIPVQGDGSGRGAANDLDCGDVRGPVRLRQAGVDPYRLDADGDGVGCDS